ncbi:MAG: hypothetical protein IKL09_03465, partial [Clostridia bacterium]|nr:hypothetical protein [Clostridia bacterium]
MVFSSLTFIYLFLPIVLILYFISPMKIKNLIIFISGILFYAWGEPICVLIMLLSTVIDYTAGIFMHKFDDNQKKRTICLIVSVVMNVGLLAIFKYSDFIIDSVNALFNLEILNPVVRLNRALNSVFDLTRLPRDYPARLRALGIRCKAFAPLTPFLSTHYNYRDHRKILVIDGHTAFTGGVNLADEYIGRRIRYGRWKGPAV